ncbi:MAG: hypothetical protein U0166_22065 [Acidobacteriota bacterium]
MTPAGGRRAAPIAIVVLLGAPEVLAESEPTFVNYEWTGSVPHGKIVTVTNVYGDVRARFGGYEDKVEVIGIIQHEPGADPRLAVSCLESKDGVTISVAPVGDAPVSLPNRVDLTVMVPDGAPLHAEVRDGLIETKGLRGDIECRARNGQIRIRSGFGGVVAQTDQGLVDVVLDPFDAAKPKLVTSTYGEVAVHIPEIADATVIAGTSGEITTDFSVEIEHRKDQEPDKVARARIGKGGQEVRIQNKQGKVKILSLQKVFVGTKDAAGSSHETDTDTD